MRLQKSDPNFIMTLPKDDAEVMILYCKKDSIQFWEGSDEITKSTYYMMLNQLQMVFKRSGGPEC